MTPPGEPLRLEAHSDTPQTLFEDVAHQFFGLLIDPQEVGPALREKASVEGESLDELLKEWMTVLLELVRTQKMVFGQFRVTAFQAPDKGPYSLQAEAVGELFDPQRHTLKLEIAWLVLKEAHLRKEGKEYRAEILLNK